MAKRPWYKRIANYFGLNEVVSVEEAPKTTKGQKANQIRRLGLAFVRGGGGRKDFEPPPFDLDEITKAYNTEAYVRQAVDKYVDLMFKAGWSIDGRNAQAVEYINMRLMMIAMATNQPIEQLFIDIAEDLVKYSNAFIIKARDKSDTGIRAPGMRVTGIDGEPPIAGYFVLPPTTIQIARDKHGTVVRYQQQVPGSEPIEFSPEQVIHIYHKKDRGFAFGAPFTLPVLDDIKALREAEENVLRLIYKHIFPFYIYQVGLPEVGFEATDEEIDEVEEELLNMPLDGGIVLPERHNIKNVGAEGEALKADEYLKYFERRVFTGLGVSEVQFGRGNTANRSTSDTMTTEMHDRIKAFQRVMSVFVDQFVINELLLEGGFDPFSRPEDDVEFHFNEIELESKIKMENHAVFQYTNNVITEDEARHLLGREPLTDQERERMFLNLVTLPIQEEKTSVEHGSKGAENKNKPTNQHGTRSGPKKSTESLQERLSHKGMKVKEYEDMLDYHWELTKDDILDLIRQYYLNADRDEDEEGRTFSSFSSKEIESILYLTKESMTNIAQKYNRVAFLAGMDKARSHTSWTKMPDLNYTRYLFRLEDENKKHINKLMDKLSSMITKTMHTSKDSEVIAKVVGVFRALEYRLRFISYAETLKAYNYGYAVSAQALGRNEAMIVVDEQPSTCDKCTTREDTVVKLTGDYYDLIPPFHPECSCSLKIE